MTTNEYLIQLLKFIKELKDEKMSREEFVKTAKDLGKQLDTGGKYYRIDSFDDHEVGWAKYWIEETDHYGIDEVLDKRFDYIKFYEKRRPLLS